MVDERFERFAIALAEGGETTSVEVLARDTGVGDWTVLCLHGFGDNLHTWQRFTSMLEPRGARVVAVDLPGLGRSPLPAGFARPYLDNAIALTRAMAARWRAERAPVFLVGNSLGGAIALGLAAEDADGAASVDGLLLLAPATPATRVPIFAHLARSPLYRWSGDVQRRLPPRARRALALLIARASFRLVLAPGRRPPPAWRDSVVDAFSRPGCLEDVERIARDVLWVLRGKSATLETVRERIPRISTPVTVMHGDADRVISRGELTDLCARVAGARLVPLPGVGHCPQIEAPERCVTALLELAGRSWPEGG